MSEQDLGLSEGYMGVGVWDSKADEWPPVISNSTETI